MTSKDGLPTYEESNIQYNFDLSNVHGQSFSLTNGPNNICAGNCILIADFIPWIEFHGFEDMGYLLLRVNNWLHRNPSYEVRKCEMVPRMINSKDTLEVSNCYIFNMTCGRKYFVNQLRIHLAINTERVVADQICLRTIIPEVVGGRSGQIRDIGALLQKCSLPLFQEMSDLITQLNNDIQKCEITGTIINISTFYLNAFQYLMNPSIKLQDDVSFFEESGQGKCHLKCLRVFYKPGSKLSGDIGLTTFRDTERPAKTLDDLTNCALKSIRNEKNQNYISMETFQEYTTSNECGGYQVPKYVSSTFMFSPQNSTLIRKEVINVFYFTGNDSIRNTLQSSVCDTEIVWITPRKNRKIYETYNSFMEYIKFIFVTYEKYILDVETNLCLNPLAWSSIRCQPLERYYNENSTNYQIYTVRLIVQARALTLPCNDAPLPCVSPSKYAKGCSIF